MTEPSTEPTKRSLIAWPLSLVAMTAALLLMTNVVTGCGGHHRERPDIDEIKEHAAEGVEHVMWRLDGTDEQTERIQAIVADAVDELAAAHGPRDDLRTELAALLTADTIDRDAMEALRVKHLDRAERMSQVVTTRLADVLEVLTPEQRQRVEERLAKHRRRRGWH
ncbi:MAG: Spy/CpxP family protein refolding chaperone [bacterium]|nr:Spy/CpxP family protein refolding chaperone [bacterium]